MVTNFQCGIVCPELEASVNGWSHAKHISYIGVAICLCAAINLRPDADSSHSAPFYSRIFYLARLGRAVAAAAADHHTDGCQPGGGSKKDPWLTNPDAQKHACAQLRAHMLFRRLARNDKCQHTLSRGHQSVSWSMTNCRPRQQTPMRHS